MTTIDMFYSPLLVTAEIALGLTVLVKA